MSSTLTSYSSNRTFRPAAIRDRFFPFNMAFAGCCKWMNLSKRMRTVSIILAHRAVVI